jgi:NAD(P)H-hydrate epimerase
MIKVATAREMQEIDRSTIEKYGIAGTVLMERAGLSVVKRINALFFADPPSIPPLLSGDTEGLKRLKPLPEKLIVLCGSGNNGGDGFVIARILHNQGKEVEVFLSGPAKKLKGDARINYDAAKKFGVKISPITKFIARYPLQVARHCLFVDALLGTGLSKEVKKPLSDVINKINKLDAPVVSVDIPSGISSDTGQVMGCAVRAQFTVTFGLPKRGHFLYPGAEHTGQLYIEDIGFPGNLLHSDKLGVNLVEISDLQQLMPQRKKYSHKGTYGHVLLVAGSKGKTGAALMAARACLRSGAGLVTIGIPETLVNAFQPRVTEEMILPLPDKGNGTLSYKAHESILNFKKANALAIGPGLAVDKDITGLVSLLVTKSKIPMVIDADGLNAISEKTALLKRSRAPVILTPHPGEMARLLRRGGEPIYPLTEIEQDRIGTAMSFSKRTKTYLVLKGVPTITATPEGETFINSSGNPGMATAGTGDVLTGMIAAFLAQGANPGDASVLGVYLHGLTGDLIAEKKGERSLIASDLIRAIPRVLK